MPVLRSVIKDNSLYFTSLLIILLSAALGSFFYTRAESFYWLNSYHNNFLTTFFIYFTFLGDGLLSVAFALILFAFNQRYLSIVVLCSYLLSGIIAQILKYFVIEARPAVFLQDSNYHYFIDTVTLHNYHGFPSGHSASAFALCTILSLSLKLRWEGLLLLFLACMVGYSRIYLGQHFLVDVTSGGIVGAISAVVCYFLIDRDKNIFKKRFQYFSNSRKV